MIDSNDPRDGFSLRRWSQRKLAAARERDNAPAAEPAPVDAKAAQPPVAAPASPVAPGSAAAPPPALPPVEELTFDSDFSPFLRPDVDETVKRGALRKLFADARFNVMDGLDVYIDDYSKPDPLPPEIARQLVQARYIFDPPRTRVNAQGVVEDVPPEEKTIDGAAPPSESPPAIASASESQATGADVPASASEVTAVLPTGNTPPA